MTKNQFMSIVITATINSVFYGFTLSKLWEWFILTTFHVPSISFAGGVGIVIIILTFLQDSHEELGSYKNMPILVRLRSDLGFVIFMDPFLALVGGYSVHLFV